MDLQNFEIPTILCEKSPGVTIAYFNGPWLPMSNAMDFANYSLDLEYPLQILEIPKRRDKIIYGIEKLLDEEQLNLFDGAADEIDGLFDEFLDLKQKNRKLYRQWVQNIKDKERNLVKTESSLDFFLKKYVRKIIMKAPCHKQCHGGEKGWSTKKSLISHLPLGSVLSFDLEDTFNRVEQQYVFDFYWGFLEDKFSDQETITDLSGFLTHISTVYNKKYESSILPQGSPISIHLFNRLFYPIDKLLNEKCEEKNLRYTRWVDDMIISAPENNRRFDRLGGALEILREDFPIALDKVFWQQDLPEYYLLGHKIIGNMIIKVDKEEAKNRGEPIGKDCFSTSREYDCWV